MKINIRGQKIKVTPAIKAYIEDKLKRIEKYFDNEVPANAVIKVNGLEQIVEITIPLPKLILRAEERNKDMYAAIDLVIDKIEGLIRKNKSRLSKRYKNSDLIDFNFDEISEIQETVKNKIVKRKELELKPMDEEEAILQLELLNHDFFIFNNVNEECLCVLYKRKDGGYGIIEAK